MNEIKRIRVAIVEDDGILREAFADALAVNDAMVVCGAFNNAEDLLEQMEVIAPDTVIMDLNLPGMNGIECTRRIKEKYPVIQVLVCTVQDDDDSLFNALCAGATGYLLKDAHPDQVVEGVKSVHAGGSPMGPGIARRVLVSFSAPRKQAKEFELLTERERQVLDQLANGIATRRSRTVCR